MIMTQITDMESSEKDSTAIENGDAPVEKEVISNVKGEVSNTDSGMSDDSSDEEITTTRIHRKKKESCLTSDDESSADDEENLSLERTQGKTIKKSKLSKPVLDSDEDSDDETSSLPQKSDENASKDSAVGVNADEESDNSDEGGSSSDSDSDSSSDDDSPPIRIFRNPNAPVMNRSVNDDASDNEYDEDEIIAIKRKSKPNPIQNDLELRSETQRLIRESLLNLPYFVPETKKLSDFLKRPQFSSPSKKVSPEQKNPTAQEEVATTSPSQVLGDTQQPTDSQTVESTQSQTPNAPAKQLTKKQRLLAASGVKLPELNVPKKTLELSPSSSGYVTLDDPASSSPSQPTGLSSFMQRFLKQKNNKKKKVQFAVTEVPVDGLGIGSQISQQVTEGQDDTLSKDGAEHLFSSCGGNYHRLKKKLNAKMKERRLKERKKKEELQKLDNEELDENEEEEDELSDWSESDQSGDEESSRLTNEKRLPVIDDVEDSNEPSLPFNDNSISPGKANSTFKNDSSSLPQLTREGSMLLFEDSIKKLSASRDDLEQSYDPMYGSMIPPNQPELSDISDCSKPAKLNFDEDSIFGAVQSPNTSASQSRGDYESQFIDSDGFIKEMKSEKSLTLLPPGAEDDNANDCNMSQLLELCSGKFQDSAVEPESSDSNDAQPNESFGFQISQGTKLDKISKLDDFSDEEQEKNEDSSGDDESEDDEAGMTIVRKRKQVKEKILRNFLEEEAELSGDDVGSEDEDDNQDDYYEEEENDEVLPDEDVIQEQVNKVHLKQILDEEQKEIELLKEAFVEDVVDRNRKRKFHWKNMDSSMTQEMFNNSSDEEDGNEDPGGEEALQDENEESKWRKMRLEREEFLSNQQEDINIDESSQLFQMGRNFVTPKRVLSEINEDSKSRPPLLTRSASFQMSRTPSGSFLTRKPEVLSKFANFKEGNCIKGAKNSDKMVFKAVSPKKVQKSRSSDSSMQQLAKRPRLDEDSNSVFDLFES